MNKKSSFKLNKLYAVIVLLSAQNAFAANFNITPYGTLPTRIGPGQSVTANYTVTNMTNTARNGYFIAGLPATVTQNTTPPNCTNPINLGPNASCNLQLTITGAVLSNFAICKGTSCTTATLPLNVSGTSTTPTTPPANPRFAYVTNDLSPVVDVCSINPDSGTNPGMLTNCVAAITGSTAGTPPTSNVQGITFNTAGTVAYLTSYEPTPSNSVFQCDINQTNGTFTTCSQVDIVTPSSPNPYYAYYGFPAVNSNSSYAFFLSYYSPEVFACPITSGVVSGTCLDTGVTGASDYAAGMTLNPANTALYIGNWENGNGVTVCTGSGTTFNSCNNILGDAGSVTFDRPSDVAFDSTNSHLYVADYTGGIIYYCTASQQSATQFTSCSIATSSITEPWSIAVNAARTYAYVADYHQTVYVCAINATTGALSPCNPITFPEPVDVALLY